MGRPGEESGADSVNPPINPQGFTIVNAVTAPPKISFTETLGKLAHAQKSNKGAPAYSRFVNRKAGRVLAAGAFQLGATPNQVTAVSAVFTFSGIAVIALAEPLPLLGPLVSALLVLGYALDAADGQLARLRGGGSLAGEWLDHVTDSAKLCAVHLAVLVTVFWHFDVGNGYLMVPIGFTLVATVQFFTTILNDQLRQRHGIVRPSGVAHSAIRSIIVLPTDYGVLCLAFVTLGFPAVFVPLYALLFAANAVFLAAALVKWFREAAALDRGMAA